MANETINFVGYPEHNVTYVEKLTDRIGYKECVLLDNGCARSTKYYTQTLTRDEKRDKKKPITFIEVHREIRCPEVVPLGQVIYPTVFGILLVGLFTLILWKIITYYIDKHEYERFQKEVKNAGWAVVSFLRINVKKLTTNAVTFRAFSLFHRLKIRYSSHPLPPLTILPTIRVDNDEKESGSCPRKCGHHMMRS